MSKSFRLTAAAGLAALSLPVAGAGAQTLTRIETHAFYGATVTVENGVRVYRPLPSTGHMIINPGGRTPVSLNYSTSVNHYIGDGSGGGSDGGGWVSGGGGGGGLWAPGWGGRSAKGRHHRRPGALSAVGMKHIHVGGSRKGHGH